MILKFLQILAHSIEQIFLTVGQNNFRNKIPLFSQDKVKRIFIFAHASNENVFELSWLLK